MRFSGGTTRKQAGLNSFILTARQWIERTGAIGIQSRAGRYGGTYAHTDKRKDARVDGRAYRSRQCVERITAIQVPLITSYQTV